MGYLFIIIMLIIPLGLFCYLFRNKNGLPTNWPFLGMLPAILRNIHRINEFCIELMEKSELTFHIKGPWFTNMHLLLTIDPKNFNHVLSKNFGNYVKGSKLIEVLAPFGDGIFNSNSTVWNYHRRVALSFFNHSNFHDSLVNITWKKVQNCLIPILDHASDHAIDVDLQDIFRRLMYDTMCIITMDHDPMSLSMDLPSFPVMNAVSIMSNVVIYRHALPTCIWKFLRWLNVGEEKKFKQASALLDTFIYNLIDRRKYETSKRNFKRLDEEDDEVSNDLLTLLMMDKDERTILISQNDEKFVRDTITNYFLAGGETTSTALSWFFYLLSKNQQVFHKIKEELNTTMKDNNSVDWFLIRNFKGIDDKLIYLHAALCEALRLYPTVAFNCKAPIESDILPSGHRVDPNMQIIFNMYAMGRMKSIWGDDCNDFKPERWILEGGMIKHEPSYKFSVFSTGPRTCIGKHMVFTQMKIVAALVIRNYRIEVIGKDHIPSVSLVLHMKDEFKVRVLRSQPLMKYI